MITYHKTEYVTTSAQLDALVASCAGVPVKGGACIPVVSSKILEIYNDGDVLPYEFSTETLDDYKVRIRAQALADLNDATIQPYIDDPELWLEAILRPMRREYLLKYDYLQGVALWRELNASQQNEYLCWRKELCDLPLKYPTFVDPETIVWPGFSFMDAC